MKLKSFDATGGPDRLATSDEIGTAMALYPDYAMRVTNETTLEIPSDRGGYVRIQAEEFEFLSLFEEINQVVK
jgi:hypothetical protein